MLTLDGAGPDSADLRHRMIANHRIDIQTLALELETSPSELIRLARGAHTLYKSRLRPKPLGGYRLIQAPHPQLKKVQQRLGRFLERRLPRHAAATTGYRGAKITAHARPHVQKKCVATGDISKCFDRVHSMRVDRVLRRAGFSNEVADLLRRLTTRNHALPQGAPTSSILLNAVLAQLDLRLANFSRRNHLSYTRFADDLAFSADYDLTGLLPRISGHVTAFGFELQPRKTQVYLDPVEQVITKTMAVNGGIGLSTEFKRRLEADNVAAHAIVARGTLRPTDLRQIAAMEGRLAYARQIDPGDAREFAQAFRDTVPAELRHSAKKYRDERSRRRAQLSVAGSRSG